MKVCDKNAVLCGFFFTFFKNVRNMCRLKFFLIVKKKNLNKIKACAFAEELERNENLLQPCIKLHSAKQAIATLKNRQKVDR